MTRDVACAPTSLRMNNTFFIVAPLALRDGPPAGRKCLFFDLYPAFIPCSALRNSGTHWANLWSRPTAL
jgi:hypothetical protein